MEGGKEKEGKTEGKARWQRQARPHVQDVLVDGMGGWRGVAASDHTTVEWTPS